MSWNRTPTYYTAGIAGQVIFELSAQEAESIIPMVKEALKDAQERYEYFNDIHQSGEATSLQQTKMVQWNKKREMWSNLLDRYGKGNPEKRK